MPDETGVEEVLELLGLEEILQGAQAVGAVQRMRAGVGLHALLQPAFLLRVLDVHILAPDLAAISAAQRLQYLPQRGYRLGSAFADGFPEGAGEKFPVEVPDGQPVGGGIEFRVIVRLGAEGIEVGDEMPAHAVRVDELQNGGFLPTAGRRRAGQNSGRSLLVGSPADRTMGHLQMLEDLFVEILFAFEQVLKFAEKHAGFGALNHAVVVGARDRHYLADAQPRANFRRHALVFGGVVDSARGDDRTLPWHQARN